MHQQFCLRLNAKVGCRSLKLKRVQLHLFLGVIYNIGIKYKSEKACSVKDFFQSNWQSASKEEGEI